MAMVVVMTASVVAMARPTAQSTCSMAFFPSSSAALSQLLLRVLPRHVITRALRMKMRAVVVVPAPVVVPLLLLLLLLARHVALQQRRIIFFFVLLLNAECVRGRAGRIRMAGTLN